MDQLPPKTGLLWHSDMLLHAISLTDPTKMLSHPENPSRLKGIISNLTLKGYDALPDVEKICEYPEATKEFVNSAHNLDAKDWYDHISQLWPENETSRENLYYTDTYYNRHTGRAALLSAGGVKVSVDKVMSGEWKNCFAAIRPPGHHAGTCGIVSGFCFINNVVCGAKYAQQKYGVRRIVIFDWDVHHGDSSQKLLYENDEILYISFHRYFCLI